MKNQNVNLKKLLIFIKPEWFYMSISLVNGLFFVFFNTLSIWLTASLINNVLIDFEKLVENQEKLINKIDPSINEELKIMVNQLVVGEKNMKDFIGRFIELKKGLIFDENNNKVGEHNGATLYTKGQRQGLNIGGVKGKKELPWYVYDKNINDNAIYVCQGVNNKLLLSKSLECESSKFFP